MEKSDISLTTVATYSSEKNLNFQGNASLAIPEVIQDTSKEEKYLNIALASPQLIVLTGNSLVSSDSYKIHALLNSCGRYPFIKS